MKIVIKNITIAFIIVIVTILSVAGQMFHPAEEIREGVFNGTSSGWFYFPGSVSIQSYFTINSLINYGTGHGHIYYDGAGGNGSTTGYLALGTDSNDRIFITDNGSVGIGTSTPTEILDINGDLRIRNLANCDSIDTDANGNLVCGSDIGADSDWTINGNDMHSSVSGNVGIGTSSPTQKLDVNGNLRIRTLTNCDTIDTDANGNLACGTDEPGVLPSGMTVFFAGNCPIGWSENTALRGRYAISIPLGGTIDGTVGTALSNLENRPTGMHNHTADPPITTLSSAGNHRHLLNGRMYINGNRMASGSRTRTNIVGNAGNHRHIVDVPAFNSDNAGSVSGTNAPYIQLRACTKN